MTTAPPTGTEPPRRHGAAPAGDLRPERLVPLLLSAGVLTPAEALDAGADLHQIGRSHAVWRLDVGGRPRAAVKLFGAWRGQTDGSAAAEAAVYALASSVPALAALLPERLDHAGPEWLVVTRWVDGRPAWAPAAPGSATGSAAGSAAGSATGSATGSAPAGDASDLSDLVTPDLATMHRATARVLASGPDGLGVPLDRHLPWAFTVFDADAPPELWSHALVAPVLAEAGQRPRLVAGVRRARGAWRSIALIHGDLKHDNVLLAADDTVRLVDWEMARIGDPAWDLAGLACRSLLDAVPYADDWGPRQLGAARSLIDAYAGATALAREPLAQRLLLYCGVWLLMTVVQYRSTTPDADGTQTRRMLDLAEASLAAPRRHVLDLAGGRRGG